MNYDKDLIMDEKTAILEYIEKLFDVKFTAINDKLDLINSSLTSNHNELKSKVDSLEGRVSTLETRSRSGDKLNTLTEIKKAIIHWGIPAIIGLIIVGIKVNLKVPS